MNLFFIKFIPTVTMIVAVFVFSENLQAQDSLSKYILTPKAGPGPHINGPKVFGVRPGHPILFTIPASGQKPIKFDIDKLPKGVKLDKNTGRLSGSIDKEGEYKMTIEAKNDAGKTSRAFR